MTELRLRPLVMMSSKAAEKEKWMSAIVKEDFITTRWEFLDTPENQPWDIEISIFENGAVGSMNETKNVKPEAMQERAHEADAYGSFRSGARAVAAG